MDANRLKQIEDLYHAARARPAPERAAFLAANSPGDDALRREVETLLAHAGDDAEGLRTPVRDAMAATFAARVAPGDRLGPYEIVELLGVGGMGEVYRAHDSRLGRDVALKVLPERLGSGPGDRERFEREARAVAALNHPNIVTIHSIELERGVRFLTMELVDGEPLATRIPARGLPVHEFLRLATPLADAVGAAHDKGIVHRDLKPANVMVTAEGRVKVLDFGLAKLRAAAGEAGDVPTAQMTGEGRIVGTVAYMSPEQAEGREVDHRSDVFSLGVVLYEMATGQRPFSGETNLSVLSSIIKDTPTSASDLNPAVPPALSRVIRTCLQKDRERRYHSAKDVRNELQTLEEELDSGELAAPPAVPPRAFPWLSLAVGGGLLAVAAVGYAVFVPRSAPPEGGPVPTFVQLTTAAGFESSPALSPDGEWLAYSSAASGNFDIYLQSVGGRNPINLTAGSPLFDGQPAFSPDGSRIAFRSQRDGGGGLFVMGRTGESPRRLTSAGFDPSWSPDGREIVYATRAVPEPERRGQPSALRIITVETGEERVLIESDGVHPSWSPDGRWVAYWGLPAAAGGYGGSNRDIRVIPAAGGDPVLVTDDAAIDWLPIWAPDSRTLYFASDRGGSMNLWRVSIDPATGRAAADPTPLTTPASYVGATGISVDGRRLVYESENRRSNVHRLAFDAKTGSAAGPPTAVTTGSRYWAASDVSADGRWLALGQALTGQEDIYVASVDGSVLRQLTDDRFNDRNPTWSPDGSRIAFYSDRGGNYEVWTVGTDGGALQQVTSMAPQAAIRPLWSPDGRHLAFTDLVTTFLIDPRRPASEQTPERLPAMSDEGTDAFRPFSWSRDGRMLAGDVTNRPGVIVYDLTTRQYRALSTQGTSPAWLPDGRIVYAQGRQILLLSPSTGGSRELFTLREDETLGLVRTSATGEFIYYFAGSADSDIWMVDFGGR
jgi:Tol biopolymer transport system component